MIRSAAAVLLGGLVLTSMGCGSDDATDPDGQGGSGGAGGAGTVPLGDVTCATPPPVGAPLPLPPKAYSGGQCPSIQAGTNTITSGGAQRQFIVALPSGYQPGERLPVAFLWHWLNGTASDFLGIGALQAVADKLRFIAVIPEKKGDVQFTWPATVIETEPRFQEELGFFDDMLSCVADQLDVNLNCVSSVGVSAGALWTDQLAWARSEYLSSIISLSGGIGDITRAWGGAVHKAPTLVAWGGETDNFGGVNFQVLSLALEAKLTEDGHFVAECVHNCGHLPPLTSLQPIVEGLVQFAIDHPFWLAPGGSPWNERGLPVGMPEFCAIGAGNAVPRTGPC